jgi:superfamily II DNA or RNA helicase
MNMRPYQIGALERLRDEFRAGRERVLLVAPTGAGKTVIAVAMIRSALEKGARVLFLAHRRELIDQASRRLGDVPHGFIVAGRKTSPAPVQVASVQTLVRRERPEAELVIVDEAHLSAADSYQTILRGYPGAIVVGLTATPWRLDGRGLGDTYESSVLVKSPRELIEEDYLCRFRHFVYRPPNLAGVRTVAGDYQQGQIHEAMKKIDGEVVETWLKRSPGPTVLFAVNRDHSRELTAKFQAAGVAADHVDGDSPDRDDIIARFRSGATRVLCNCAILSEGFDLPSVACIIMARPTKSVALYLQQAGRGLRKDGDKVLHVHDHAGNGSRLGCIDAERDYSLTTGRPEGQKAPAVWTCKKCFAIFDAPFDVCEECGAEVKRKQIVIAEVPGEERELVSRPAPDAAGRFLVDLIVDQIRFDRKPAWVGFQFKARYGFWPRASFVETARRIAREQSGNRAAAGDQASLFAPERPALPEYGG